jgi:hypothetical protein
MEKCESEFILRDNGTQMTLIELGGLGATSFLKQKALMYMLFNGTC